MAQAFPETKISCLCHTRYVRLLSFDSSAQLKSIPCWCGLLRSYTPQDPTHPERSSRIVPQILGEGLIRNTPHETPRPCTVEYRRPTLPVLLHATFWKVPVKSVTQKEPALQPYLKTLKDNQDVHFISNYLVGPALGEGTRGKVRRGLVKTPDNLWHPVSLKFYFKSSCVRHRVPVFDANGLKEMVTGWARVQAEWLLQGSVHHRNVTGIIELIWNAVFDVWILVMECGARPVALFDMCRNIYSQDVGWGEKRRDLIPVVSEETLLGLEALHQQRIVHKDLKCENILFSREVPPDGLRWIALENIDKEPVVLKGLRCPRVEDWEDMSESTEDFLWENVSSHDALLPEDFEKRLSTELERYKISPFCFCCAMARGVGCEERWGEESWGVNEEFCEEARGDPETCACCSLPVTPPLYWWQHQGEVPLVRLIDFSVAVQVEEPLGLIYDADGTRHFTPPECFPSFDEQGCTTLKYGFSRDLWSVGCVLYCLLLGRLPFDGESPVKVILNIKKGFSGDLPHWISREATDLLRRLLESDPMKRITLLECLKHPWHATISNENPLASMRITVTSPYSGKTIQYDVYEELDFSAFQTLVQEDFLTPKAGQIFFNAGELLKPFPGSTLKSINVSHNDILVLTSLGGDQMTASRELDGLFTEAPLSSSSFTGGNGLLPRDTSSRALLTPSLDPYAQSILLKRIQQQHIDEAYSKAQEYLPESFVSVTLLYIRVEMNGLGINALVDSGAQLTIISAACAKRCGLTRLIDSRFHGLVKGVGTSQVAGRIHLVQLKMGSIFLTISLTVVEDSQLDFIFGLDLLRRYQCTIDLAHDHLRISKETIPFLSEAELRRSEV